jgi:hypothetical protein
VILPTFNRAHLIAASLESLFAQTYPIAEILVVDDGSTDDTGSVVSGFAERVHYVRQKNGGKNAALNTGLRRVQGDLVWIMDDDDIAPPDALENLVAPFIADPSTAISYGALQKFRENETTGEILHELTHPYPPEDGRSFFVRVMEDCYITGQPCLLVRRACYDEIFPLPEKNVISEDYAVLLLLARRWPATRVANVTLLQRQHDGPRGPAEIRYAAESRNARWSKADTELLRNLLPELSLGELVGRAGAELEIPVERRQALFQKATIAARKKLWPTAIEAVQAGVREAPDAPLSDMDQLILGRMLGCRYGLDELMEEPGILDELRGAFSGLSERRKAVGCIAALLPYLVKVAVSERDFRKAIRLTRLYLSFAGLFRGSQLLLSKLWEKVSGQKQTDRGNGLYGSGKVGQAH